MAKKKKWRRWKRRLARGSGDILFILFVLGLAAVWATLPSLLEPRVKELIITKGASFSKGRLSSGVFN
jgi:hypothetical protein